MNFKQDRIGLVNQETGEIITVIPINEGDLVITERQRNSFNDKKQRRTEKNFIFAIYERCEEYMKNSDLKSQDITRIIMLSTYADYDGRLMLTERTHIKKKDIKEILRETSENRFNDFFNTLISLKILIKKENGLYLSKNYFIKGNLPNSKTASRIFIKEIREIFNGANTRDFKKIGYIFKLLPYLSCEYNIVCLNPEEKSLELVNPLTNTQISKILNIDRGTVIRVIKSLGSIKINGEYLLGWFNFGSGDNLKLIINPSVIYSGKAHNESVDNVKMLFKKLFEM